MIEKKVVDLARDELNTLCENIRCLKEENDELKEELKQLSALVSASREHTNTHFNDKDDFVGIDGYGPFSMKQSDKDTWVIQMLKERVVLFNRKGRRVRGSHEHLDRNPDGDW
jgi:hypothetical protein